MFFRFITLAIGFGLGILSFALIATYSGLFTTRCPAVNGRTCNNRGTCESFGICACDVQFSGVACEHTQCPGYRELSGATCSSRGVCSPLMQTAHATCAQTTPIAANGFRRLGYGWDHRKCRLAVSLARLAFTDNPEQMAGIPTCACHPPWGGDSCEINMCPLTSDFAECGGNGNRTVGYARNDTKTGTGCQCKAYTSLLGILPQLTRPQVALVQTKYLHAFKRGFCGTPLVHGETIVFKQANTDIQCFCDEKHHGVACEYGVCPEVNDVMCAGRGHPDLGFDLARGTLIPTHTSCTPVCTPPATLCDGVCKQTCGKPLMCDVATPIRCATGECVVNTQRCGREYQYGSWDDPSTIPAAVECTIENVNAVTDLFERSKKLLRCFGRGSELLDDGFITSGSLLNLDSRVLAVSMETVGNGTVNVTYGTQTYVVGIGRTYLTLQASESSVYLGKFVSVDHDPITITRTGSDRILVNPDPTLRFPSVVQFRAGSVVFNPLVREAFLDAFGPFAMALAREGRVLAHDGNEMTLDECITHATQCFWLNGTSLDGTRFLCPSSLGYFETQAEPGCSVIGYNASALTTYSITLSAGINDTEIELGGADDLELQVPSTPSREMRILTSEHARIVSIKIVQESDVLLPCRCPPFGSNYTELNVAWLAQTTRYEADEGDTAVGVRVLHGVVEAVRGHVTPAGALELVSGTHVDSIRAPLRISRQEFGQGTPQCDLASHPARCADGTCTALEYVLVDGVSETCSCTLTPSALVCTCEDVFGTVRTCVDSCGVTMPLNETCEWIPAYALKPVIGFIQTNTTTWTSLDTTPVFIQLSTCSAYVTLNGIVPHSECINSTLLVLPDVQFEIAAWVLETNVSVLTAEFVDDFGGVPVVRTNLDVVLNVSSNDPGDAVMDTSPSTWTSSLLDHDASITYTFPHPVTFTAVFLDLVTVGLSVDGGTIPVSVYIQGAVVQGEWMTLARHMDEVVNGSSRVTLSLTNDESWTSVRLHSYYPLEVRTFMPYIEQDCVRGTLNGTSDMIASVRALLLTPPNLDSACVCEDTCEFAGISAAMDGICSDSIAYPDLNETCSAGTDCTDCGSSPRRYLHDRCATPEERVILPTLSLATAWTPYEYVYVGGVQFTFELDVPAEPVWRLVKRDCPRECPLITCGDGSCALAPAYCPATTYNCPGDGCVRASITLKEYKCACQPGWSGLECTIHDCTPGDPATGRIDPHKWCTCNGPSPLRIKPPYELVLGRGFTAFSDDDVMRINRPSARISSDDVGWMNIRAEKAPFGIPFLRTFKRGAQRAYYTNCPYQVRTSLGVFLELEACVASRSAQSPHEVTAWRTWPVLDDGEPETFQWNNETHYDDAPYRCPTGQCVAHERECYSVQLVSPVCGGHGKCLADGTCRCDQGRETFVITHELTQRAVQPYGPNPSRWGHENTNEFASAWCQARNCSSTDCSPPMGCFPGTPLLLFEDKWMECVDPPNMCAKDIHGCRAGETESPRVCSGNGELRLRDYHDNEWYCACGSYVDGVFRSNGYGGSACQDYSCQDDVRRIWFARHVPLTLERFEDRNGIALPGRWMGPCGAIVGANPDDVVEWSQCCPEISQLEMCDRVPCIVAGETTCLPVDECRGATRTPKVYVCNGKGVALADGTCDCKKNVAAGTGFTYDLAVYSQRGCFRPITCSRSVSGEVCNAMAACSDFTHWPDFPLLPYVTQQAAMFAVREGLPLTNQSIVSRLVGDEIEQVILQTYVQVALGIQAEIRGLATDVCVYPGDNCTLPFGMPPCGDNVLLYKEAITSPYLLAFDPPFLGNGNFYSEYDVYVQSSNPIDMVQTLTLTLQDEAYVDIVRLHLLVPTVNTTVSFIGSAGVTCPGRVLDNHVNLFAWETFECQVMYVEYRFDLADTAGWFSQCAVDVTTLVCEQWMQETCVTIPNGVVRLAGSLDAFTGCNSARCCIALNDPNAPTTFIIALFSEDVLIDEAALFGHRNVTQPMPDGLTAIIQSQVGVTTCVDEILMLSPDFDIPNLEPFRAPGVTAIHSDGVARCEYYGGAMATVLGDSHIVAGYARSMGEACFLDRTDSVGCHVSARDRNEVRAPIDLEHLFRPSCLQYGCFETTSNTRLTYHADPNEATQWDTIWSANLTSWPVYMDRMMTEIQRQRKGIQYLLYRKMLPAYIRPFAQVPVPGSNSDIPNDLESYPFAYDSPRTGNMQVIPDAPLHGDPPIVITAYRQTVYAYDLAAQKPVLQDSTTYSMWTNPQTCVIQFFNRPNCGEWISHPSDLDAKYFFMRDAAVKTYVVTPSNYETVFANNLFTFGEQFDSCLNTAKTYPICRPDNVEERGTMSQHTRSFLIQGDCKLDVTQLDPDTATWFPKERVEPNTNVGTSLKWHFRNARQILEGWVANYVHANLQDQYGQYWLEGCHAQIGQNRFPLGTDNGARFRTASTSSYVELSYANDRRMLAFVARVVPNFRSARVDFNIMAEMGDMNEGTDAWTMGYVDHPFMCAAVRAVQTKRILPEHLTVITESNVVTWDIPMIPRGTALFWEDETCTPTLTEACLPLHNLVACDDLGRSVVPCIECETPKAGHFSFLQEFYYNNEFADVVDAMRQVGADGGQVVYPKVYVNSPLHFFVALSTLPSLGLERNFARLSVSLKGVDYDVKVSLDYCVQVVRGAVTGAYMFDTILCSAKRNILCVRDTLRYTAKKGTQCDVCGDQARNQALEPGATAFTRFPSAVPENDPMGHAILASYLDGTLELLVDRMEDVPWDLVYAHVARRSFIFAFPEARAFLISGTSTRPGFASLGSTEDAVSWVDMNFARWFPYDCGMVLHPETGVHARRCAVSREYCSYTHAFDGTLMAQGSMPLMLRSNTTVSRTNPLCGLQIKVGEYGMWTDLGGPQPYSGDLVPVDASVATFKVARTNSTWRNTGRRAGVDLFVPFTLTGSVRCSVQVGMFRIWVGSISPTFGVPALVQYLTNWTAVGVPYELTVADPDDSLAIVGFDFAHMQVGSTLTITPVLATTEATMEQCSAMPFMPYVELPSAVDSAAPLHECVYSDAYVTRDEVVGECACAPDSPFAGPACEWPAVANVDRGKQICNGFGDDGGRALTRALTTTPLVDTSGIYLDGDAYECKCEDVGLTVQAVLRPESAFDFAFVLRKDKEPNAPDFEKVISAIQPVLSSNVREVCNSASAALPSWNTANEILFLHRMDVGPVYVDLVLENNVLRWDQRNEIFSISTRKLLVQHPCAIGNTGSSNDYILCAALNYNNVVFNTSHTLTDGSPLCEGVCEFALPLEFPFHAVTNDVVVDVSFSGAPDDIEDLMANLMASVESVRVRQVLPEIQEQRCIAVESGFSKVARWECPFANITKVGFYGNTVDDQLVAFQVGVYSILDPGRVTGYLNF